MKKLFFILGLTLASSQLMAQTATATPQTKKETSKKVKKEKEAVIKFEATDNKHDFGTIPEGPAAEYVFKFKNTGKAPLIIQSASASCGCTTPEWPKEPILPGKKGELKVSYNTKGRVGPFTKSVFIMSNAANGTNGRYELTITGTVKKAETTKEIGSNK